MKTIFAVLGNVFTAINEETKTQISIISIWESNEGEVETWKRKQ